MKKNIVIIGPYLPGKSFGGPVKSILNMVDTLSGEYYFDIITGDRDLNATEPYRDVNIGEWNKVGKANVFYIPKGHERKCIRKIFHSMKQAEKNYSASEAASRATSRLYSKARFL